MISVYLSNDDDEKNSFACESKIKQLSLLYKTIQDKFGIKSPGYISMINSGKYFYDKNETYPLCDKQGKKAQNEAWVEQIRQEILNTSTPLLQIAKKFNKSYATVKNINSGRSHKKEGLTYPLRQK